MMEDFKYRVSVIVPVYNGEEFLRECLNSLLTQTISQGDMEVLLIDDGSSDSSLEICQEYAELYDCFKVFSKENEGLSATRNFGLDRAAGKYIIYLDCDDTFTKETLKNICDFFDKHYDEIDEVTFPIVRYKNGKTFPLHYRYKYLNKTGVYDLREYPYISQTNINICVKNMRDKNIQFDTTPGFRHEDQKYNNMVLSRKMRIGFVKEAEYRYNRNNEGSIINTYMFPYYTFETTMAFHEWLFSQFEDKVPEYYQALYINDLQWKLEADKLFPFHYNADEFKIAMERIKSLLARCDVDTIVKHPSMNNFHAQYWLAMKPNISPCIVANQKRYDIMVENKSIYYRDYFEIIMHKVRVQNGQLRMLGFVKSPIYNHLSEKCNIYVVENNNVRKKMNVFISVHSYFRNQFTQTNNFYAFDYRCNVNEVSEYYFEVELDGFTYPTKYWCMPTAVFDLKKSVNRYVRENTLLILDGNKIRLQSVDKDAIDSIEHGANERYRNKMEVFLLREQSLSYRKKHRVWLYYDAYTVQKDNAYYQFQNDFRHGEEDGIERYYVTFDNGNDNLFDAEQKKYLIRFGSQQHKLLYLSCERIFTAYYGFTTISPFLTEASESDYADIIKFKTIYLQHGVLHAALRTYNAVERCRAEQIVVSSYFEIDNYMKNYNYSREDLIPTGMARYDYIDRNCVPENRILYAPSWRKYLTVSDTASSWNVVIDKLLESDYFSNIIAFLNSDKLIQLLEKNDLYLDVKLHPIIAKTKEAVNILDFKSDRINMITEDCHVENYKMFITDFSSFVFDYACLNRPILYYVTDYIQFKSGMNHYKSLDLDFKDAFGPLATDPETAVECVKNYVENRFVVPDIYSKRMKEFFVPLNNCCEALYQYLMNPVE